MVLSGGYIHTVIQGWPAISAQSFFSWLSSQCKSKPDRSSRQSNSRGRANFEARATTFTGTGMPADFGQLMGIE